MSPNRYQEHIIILPEDDAIRQIVNGFCSSHCLGNTNRILQIADEARGWSHAKTILEDTYVKYLKKFPKSRVIVVIDFDSQTARRDHMLQNVPEEIKERVFIIGSFSNPESLRNDLNKSFETIGKDVAEQCAAESADNLWDATLLRHNQAEIVRLSREIRDLLFPA